MAESIHLTGNAHASRRVHPAYGFVFAVTAQSPRSHSHQASLGAPLAGLGLLLAAFTVAYFVASAGTGFLGARFGTASAMRRLLSLGW